ncbi:hypothetical protein AMK26_23380 [Streptomyces sp. CB03234]|uniref:DUF2470 domain-containing protein n=1 Tax=Streptomyces sp. (strain CB03234) TaxID=1703937 RepID=UPI00093F9297|nr:DUF2470 domain-containing protein [Streptomyces sp. CB03234]OKK02567.1 hypothetical protein AMK26_23380 [Streptomyces sp. CB03234]
MSSDTGARPPEPTPAERVRSVLAAARSLTVVTHGYRCDLTGAHRLDDRARLTLRLPADGHLAAAVGGAPHGDLAAMLQFTDVAPTAVRDRVRARVTLSGWLTQAGAATAAGGVDLRLDPVRVTFGTADDVVFVGLDELVLAEADPLAEHEAGLLLHLADDHPDAVERLARLVPPHHLHGVRRVAPLAVDRYGVTLRLEHARAHHDVRLPFAVPLRDAAEFGDRVQALLTAAHGCPRRRRGLRTRP